MKALLLVFSDWLNKQFRLINPELSKESDFIVEFMVRDKKDLASIIKYLEDRDYENNDDSYIAYFRCLDLYNISINEVLKFSQYRFCSYKYNSKNFDANHDFIHLKFDYIPSSEVIKTVYGFIKTEYSKYIVDHPIKSIDYLKFDYKSDEDVKTELLESKFEERISKIIDSKIDKLRTELLEVIETKFKELESRINKYF